MKNVYLILLISVFGQCQLQAQKLDYGINGGITTSTIIGLIPVSLRKPTEIGYTGGAFVRYYPEDNRMVGVTLGIRYNTMSSSVFTSTQTSNRLVLIEESFEHEEQYLRVALSGEFKLLKGKLPLYASIGISGHNVLAYRETDTTARIITDGSSPPSVESRSIDYDHHLFIGPHGGLALRYKRFGLGVDLSVFAMNWRNGPKLRTSRFEFLASYTL